MTEFDRNQKTQIEHEIQKNVKWPKIGQVTRVYEHVGANDDSNFEVDVAFDAGTKEERRCPVETPGPNTIDVPRVGDTVIIEYRDTGRKPYVSTVVYTSSDRPPIGRAGMWRREVASGDSPAGSGDLYVTAHTRFDGNPATTAKDQLSPEASLIRLAKEDSDIPEPTARSDTPAKIELYDAPSENDSHISVEINRVGGSSSDATWGMKFDIVDGSFTIADANGFGIESDGSGNMTFHYSSLTENQISGSTGPLDL